MRNEEGAFRRILRREYRPYLVMAVAFPVFLNLTGVTMTAFFSPILFRMIGFGSHAALMGAVILASGFAMDCYGRKLFFMIGGALMFTCQACTRHRTRSHSVKMPGSGGTVLDDLPESIIVDEILIRLPPKDLLRCRSVRKCWYSATYTDKFMLDHRRRQPLLPTLRNSISQQHFVLGNAAMGQQQLCPVLRCYGNARLQAALDGLLIVSHGDPDTREFFICNPVTRKCAPLGKPPSHQAVRHYIAGFYRHQPSGEYRVLWVSLSLIATPTISYYVVAVGSNDTRCIQQQASRGLGRSADFPPVHHRGSLHWEVGNPYIKVFNTTTETFRLMYQPAQLCPQDLLFLEMDGTLALCNFSSERDTIDVWLMQDYDTETWSFKHRITLSRVDPLPHAGPKLAVFPRMVVLNEGELLIQLAPGCVQRYDMDGKFLGYVECEEGQGTNLWITNHYLQESVIPLPLFHEMRDEDDPPFFVGL